MNLTRLHPFIEASRLSNNLQIKIAADSLNDQITSAQQAEEISQPTLHAQQRGGDGINNPAKDEIDKALGSLMPDILKPEPNASEFGKAASAYASDVEVGSLPKATQEDIFKFTPTATKRSKVVQYGMVVSELIPKVDSHNYKSAIAHVQNDISKNGKRAAGDKFQDKVKDKYILLLNDSIVDGHHFLALADKLGISCSLKVLDLTPIRFQQKTAHSLFYALRDNSWQATT